MNPFRHARLRVAGFAAGAVLVSALAGCTTPSAVAPDADAGEISSALARVPVDVSTVQGLDLPLDPSILTPVQEMEVVKARDTLIEQCLVRYGITFTFPPIDPVHDAATTRRYGLVDAAEAAAYGYRDPAVFAVRRTDADRQPSPDVVSVITGTHSGPIGGRDVPAAGCAGEADRRLAADGRPGQEPVSFGLSLRSHEIAQTTPPVVAAAAAWSRCMAEAGLRYADPDAAIADPAFSSGRASEHEIAVATQDVRCKERVQWVKTYVAVERAVQEVLISRHTADVARERQHKDAQLAIAREING